MPRQDEQNPIIEWLLARNKEQSALYCNPDQALLRRQYRAKHPTRIAALKCMDGRILLPRMTNSPVGVIQPFRNIGGVFDLGWPFFGVLLKEWEEGSVAGGHDGIILVTYHFSKEDPHRGCRGFNYDTEAAKAAAQQMRTQIERVFGRSHSVIYPVVVGIETDEDALIFHGADNKTLDVSSLSTEVQDEEVLRTLHALFPDMKQRMLLDLLPLVLGNRDHIAHIRHEKRPIADLNHREQVLAIGRGFDWLHVPNRALIIGPFSYDLATPIAAAAGILLNNLRTKTISEDEGVVIMSSGLYKDPVGPEHLLAAEKAASLARLTVATIKEKVPDLVPHLAVLVGTVDVNTRLFTPLSKGLTG